MECVAFEPSAIELYPTKSAWDATAADLVHTMLDRWHLAPGAALVGGEAASVVEVTTREGDDAVLKLGFPHVEAVGEAIALEAWAPELAPRVLRQDPWTWAMLLERVRPGVELRHSQLPVLDRVAIGSALLERIAAMTPPPGVPALGEITGEYLRNALVRLPAQAATLTALGALEGVERGLALLEALTAGETGRGFVHGDLNPHNILRTDDRWVLIDPKPMVGSAEFDVWPLVTQLGDLGGLTSRLHATRLANDRAVEWGIARSALDVTWALMDGLSAREPVRVLRAWLQLSES